MVITTTKLHSTKSELRLCAGSNPARGVSEIRDRESVTMVQMRLNTFRWSTIPQEQLELIFSGYIQRIVKPPMVLIHDILPVQWYQDSILYNLTMFMK